MNFIINLDKPKGITSQQAVTRVKKIVGTKKAGHAGTLDPIATGILLVCVGEATKITRFLMGLDKEYVALMKLGDKTDTLDAEGRVVRRVRGFHVASEEIEEVLKKFRGPIVQNPPMYSAIKVQGEPLYKLARKGIEIERAERSVTIHEIELTRFESPLVWIRVLCSKGTYIRTLCDDIGEALGVGAHVVELRRTRTGNFSVSDSVTVGELEKERESGVRAGIGRGISSLDKALEQLEEVVLTEPEFINALNGSPFRRKEAGSTEEIFMRLKDPRGNLFAIGRALRGTIKIERILHVIG